MNKPEPIRVSAEGIAPKPITMHEAPTPGAAEIQRLPFLPPFQMFAAERMRNMSRHDSEQHAANFLRSRGTGLDVLEEYVRWHAAKGYWPNETPFGALKSKE
jgi:hypothetical protein